MRDTEPLNTDAAARNASVGLKTYLDDMAAIVKRVPASWVRCELHALKVSERFTRMEFIEVDSDGKQIAKVQGGCWSAVWQRIDGEFKAAGLVLEAGSQVLVKLQSSLHSTFGFQIVVSDVDLTFALGDLNARMQSIRKHLQDTGVWNWNRSLPHPADFVRVSVIAPAGAAGLGDFRSTADRLAGAGLAEFVYHEVPFQTRDAPARIVDVLRSIYRSCNTDATRHCAVAIIRGGGASADLAWLVDQKLAEAVCRMNVPVMTGIGHERDRNLLDEIACIPCDTPSKVVEHIRSTITGAALDGQRAQAAIQTHAAQIANRHEAAVALARTAIDRDARETLRLAEATVRVTATGLQPGARTLLDDTRAAVTSARTAIDRHARDTVRLAETSVRRTATVLEPGARALLDDTQTAVVMAMESARAASRQRRELADQAVRDLRRSVTSWVETAIRPLELGTGKALSEISARLEAIPQSASDKVGSVHRDIAEAAERSAGLVGEMVASLRQQAVRDANRSLDDCQSTIAIVRERADSLHPRTVLAAGYAILRDRTGLPLTGVAAVKRTGLITAEMRDGGIDLRNTDANQQGEASG
jgi:exodeoxyribonuclease VII large subunit